MRINKYLASSGLGSRRKCEEFVIGGRVTINGRVETNLAFDVSEKDKVLFDGKEIRSIWDSEKEEYFFSVVDVISALTDSKIPRNYWSDLKRKLFDEGSELHEKIVQLKLKSNKDGKMYLMNHR